MHTASSRPSQFRQLKPLVEKSLMAIRCNSGAEYSGGAGYNLDCDDYRNSVEYATALYASICFAQDTRSSDLSTYRLLLLVNCSLGGVGDLHVQTGQGLVHDLAQSRLSERERPGDFQLEHE